MNKAAKLYDDYEKALASLQLSCQHEKLTDYIGEMWAPGHMSGREVQVCEECNKVVHERKACWNCLGYIFDDKGYDTEGKNNLPHGGCWCSKECAVEAYKRGKDRGYACHLSRNEFCRQCKKIFLRDEVMRYGFSSLCSEECGKLYAKKQFRS